MAQKETNKMKNYMILALTLTAVALSVAAFAANTGQVDIPIALTISNPCNGELVDVSGTVHGDGTITTNGNNAHATVHFNAAGVTGIGETTGAIYRGVGVTQQVF